MKYSKIISIILTFTLFISFALPPVSLAMEPIDFDDNESLISENEFLAPQLDTEEYNKYIFDTENYLNEHPVLKRIFDSFSDVEKQYFWDSINTARTSFDTESQISDQTFTSPRVAPVVWFVAATCARLVASQIPKATLRFSVHAIQRANERQLTSKQVADAIVNGRKYMDRFTRARVVYDKESNINVVFIGNSKEVSTIYKPSTGEIALKFVNSNWSW
ncbi:hypothetical protein [Lysinibacillus sp. NPDC093688]|uniref:hypothetical protein n=1 Tax=Lysinibacillus sp. NPDC093688 TaxID=3390577 RepID=UPI003D04C48D